MISCHLHDYIEIACLYGFEVRLNLRDGRSCEGQATTTETSPDKIEWLILRQQNGDLRIQYEHIKTMQALTRNPHFDRVDFD
jgi:Rho-binding antiterminator